ncbi:wings apart-like protein homolog isoform X2 [Tachypleus tridentatus]|uniref:wings apart-like protein homolog isoform X2 n=2 Tax=Tachypleus tridentatus TaxID=6853 RepID=UPI003FD5BD95
MKFYDSLVMLFAVWLLWFLKMSRLGTKTYNQKQDCKSSIKFDQLLSDSCNKPSMAKVSMTSVRRWGMTSFTSLRKSRLHGHSNSPIEDFNILKKPRIESTGTSGKIDPFSFSNKQHFSSSVFSSKIALHSATRNLSCINSNVTELESNKTRPKKFFKSSDHGLKIYGSLLKTNEFLTLKPQCNLEGGNLELDALSHGNATKTIISVKNFDDNNILMHQNATAENIQPDLTTSMSCDSASFNMCENISENDNFDNFLKEDLVIKRKPVRMGRNYLSDIFDQKSDASPLTFDSQENQMIMFTCNEPSVNSKSKQVPTVIHTYSHKYVKPVIITCEPHHSVELKSSSDYCGNDITKSSNESETVASTLPQEEFLVRDTSENFRDKTKLLTFSQGVSNNIQDTTVQDTFGQSVSEDTSELHSFDQNISKESMQLKVNQPAKCSKKIFSNSKKNKAVYNHRYWQSTKEMQEITEDATLKTSQLAEEFEEVPETQTVLTKLIRHPARPWHDPVTSYKCPRKVKELYTVVKNVKKAHQCHEFGETQEFSDDVEYLLEGIQFVNKTGTRCLSVLSLATKCMAPSFRIYIRAHGTAPKIFSALMDAPTEPNLALCTALLLFILSQDRLTIDLDARSLSLMLQLLETDPEDVDLEVMSQSSSEDGDALSSRVQVSKNREKVIQLCEQMKLNGHAKHLSLDKINTGNLAMETLLSLSSRKAGEWFKEDIRTLGGLDHIVDTVKMCVTYFDPQEPLQHREDAQLDRIRKIDQCLRVLENVTYMNGDNQAYLLSYKESTLVLSCVRMLRACRVSIPHHPLLCTPARNQAIPLSNLEGVGAALLSCLLSLLKVLLNLTHESSLGCQLVGSHPGLLDCALLCILQMPQYMPLEQRFDLLVLSLGLLINLMENCKDNREKFIFAQTVRSFDSQNDCEEVSAVEAFVEVFMDRVEAARQSEEQADALLSTPEEKQQQAEKQNTQEKNQDMGTTTPQSVQTDDLEDTLMKALQKAGKNMEHSIIGAYIAILLGCTIQNNEDFTSILKSHMPQENFTVMVEVLKKFYNFVNLTVGCNI